MAQKDSSGMQPIREILEDIQVTSTGVPPDESQTLYDDTCKLCRGGHFVYPLKENGKPDYSRFVPCLCVAEKMQRERFERLMRSCELPPRTEKMTFESFDKRPGLEVAYDLAVSLADGESKYKWLTLIGDTDCGKTHIGISIIHRWLSRGVPARYAHVPLLLDELRRGFREGGDRSYESRFDFFLNVPLLMLDDLGTENSTPWVQEKLDTIVDYRLMNDLALVVTTNTPFERLPIRIASRLQRGGNVEGISAPSYEEFKKENNHGAGDSKKKS